MFKTLKTRLKYLKLDSSIKKPGKDIIVLAVLLVLKLYYVNTVHDSVVKGDLSLSLRQRVMLFKYKRTKYISPQIISMLLNISGSYFVMNNY